MHCQYPGIKLPQTQSVRWGGEEFLLILFNVTKDEAYELSEKVRRQVEQFVIPYGDKGFFCTMTLGLHIFHEQEGWRKELAVRTRHCIMANGMARTRRVV